MRTISWFLKLGLFFSLLAIFFGFAIGGAMGGLEDAWKAHLKRRAENAPASVYEGKEELRAQVLAKSWNYVQRAHLHGGGIGTAALASILALIVLVPKGRWADLSGLAFGVGSLVYPIFWLLAAEWAPRLGSTSAAKKMLEWVAIPGAGLSIIGLLGTMAAIIFSLFVRAPKDQSRAR